MHRRRSLALTLVLVLSPVAACSKGDPAPAQRVQAKADAKPEPPPPPAIPEPLPLLDPADPNEACAQIIVAAYKGADGAPEDVVRDTEAAKVRIDELLARAKDPVNDLRLLAGAESDAASKERGGAIGTHTREGWPEKHAAIADLVFGLKVNEIGGPVEAPYGWTIARRCLVEKVHTRHILIRYAGAQNAPEDITRSKAEAKALAIQVMRQVSSGKDFSEVAKEHSEDGSAEEGGDMGFIGRGMFVPPYEEMAFSLDIGDMAHPVETVFGFHIIKREG